MVEVVQRLQRKHEVVLLRRLAQYLPRIGGAEAQGDIQASLLGLLDGAFNSLRRAVAESVRACGVLFVLVDDGLGYFSHGEEIPAGSAGSAVPAAAGHA